MGYRELVIADGAVAYWRLGETSGTVARSEVGSFDGTISGGVTLNQPGALSDGNKAMAFNGTTGKVTGAAISFPVGCTFEAWINFNTLAQKAVFSNRPGNSGIYFGVTSAGRAFLFMNPPTSCTISGSRNLANGAWHQIALTFDGTTARMYSDGIPDGTVATTGAATALAWSIGHDVQNIEYFNGSIDEVAIYPTTLTPAQIAAHYAAGIASLGSKGLAGYIIREDDDMVRYNVTGALTPSNTVDLSRMSDAIWVGGGGDITIVGGDGRQTVIKGVPAGTLLPISARRVMATGTTATDLVAMYAS